MSWVCVCVCVACFYLGALGTLEVPYYCLLLALRSLPVSGLQSLYTVPLGISPAGSLTMAIPLAPIKPHLSAKASNRQHFLSQSIWEQSVHGEFTGEASRPILVAEVQGLWGPSSGGVISVKSPAYVSVCVCKVWELMLSQQEQEGSVGLGE